MVSAIVLTGVTHGLYGGHINASAVININNDIRIVKSKILAHLDSRDYVSIVNGATIHENSTLKVSWFKNPWN